MALERLYTVARVGLPDSDRLVERSRYDVCAIGRERYRANLITMALKRLDALARIGLPDSYRPVPRPRHDMRAIA